MLSLYHLTEKRKANILDNLNNTNGTIIGVTCCIVLILLIVSVIVQIKQPRKKYILRREDFDPTMFQEVFEPPHYELCTLRSATTAAGASADLVDLAEDFENYHALRRASSRCIHDHHCGSSSNPGSAHISQLSLSGRGSRGNLSAARDAAAATLLTDLPQPPMAVRPLLPSTGNRRSILVMKHSYSQEAADNGCDLDDDLEEVPTTSHRLSRHEKAVQRSVSIDFWWGKNNNRRVNYGEMCVGYLGLHLFLFSSYFSVLPLINFFKITISFFFCIDPCSFSPFLSLKTFFFHKGLNYDEICPLLHAHPWTCQAPPASFALKSLISTVLLRFCQSSLSKYRPHFLKIIIQSVQFWLLTQIGAS